MLATLFDRGFVPERHRGRHESVRADDRTTRTTSTPPTPTADVPPHSYHNYNGEGGSVGTILTQTLQSSNCGFARLGQIVGLRNVIDKAKAMGISNEVWNAYGPDWGSIRTRSIPTACSSPTAVGSG